MTKSGNSYAPNINTKTLRRMMCFLGLAALTACSGSPDGPGGRRPLVMVDRDTLYADALPEQVYRGRHGQDSVLAVRQYAEAWARDRVFLYYAARNTDTARIRRLTEDYRRALLREFYETRLREMSLDTVHISRAELLDFYARQKENFRARDTFVRWRYMIVDASNPKAYRYRRWFFSSQPDDRSRLEKAYKDLLALQIDTTGWVKFSQAHHLFPGLSLPKYVSGKRPFHLTKHRDNRLYVADITAAVRPGDVLPFELVRDRLRYFLKQHKWEKQLHILRSKMLREAQEQKIVKYEINE